MGGGRCRAVGDGVDRALVPNTNTLEWRYLLGVSISDCGVDGVIASVDGLRDRSSIVPQSGASCDLRTRARRAG